jgi:hypothetical protein
VSRAHPSRPYPLAWVWLGAAVVGSLALAAGLAGRTRWLNPAFERSPFTWASVLATLVAAVCAAVLARRDRGKSRLFLAVGLAYIAVDDALGLHERFAADLDPRALASFEGGALPLVANTLLLGAVAVLLLLELRSARPASALIAAGTALLAVAVAARFGGGALAAIDGLPAGEPRAAGEAAMHACGLSGWMLVAAGLLVRARDASAFDGSA